MKENESKNLLKKAAVLHFVEHIDPHQVLDLQTLFKELDTSKDGLIGKDELLAALSKSEITFPENEIDDLISELDTHQNGQLNYSEFLAASINLNDLMTEKKLAAIF